MVTPLSTPQSQEKEIIRVSISEAARLFGVNAQTIRRAIKNQEITYVVVAGRYKINFVSLVKWSQTKTTIKINHKNSALANTSTNGVSKIRFFLQTSVP